MFAEHQYRIFHPFFFISPGNLLYAMFLIKRGGTGIHHISQIRQCGLRKSMVGRFPYGAFLMIINPAGSYQFFHCLTTEICQYGRRQEPVICKGDFYLLRFERRIAQFGKLSPQMIRLRRPCQFLFTGKRKCHTIIIFICQCQRKAEVIIGQ